MSTPLDLAGADLKGFAALDAGRYNAEVSEMAMDAVKNTSGEGAMPAGTPMIKVQFKILDPKIGGEPIDQDRRIFSQYIIPPPDYDKKKAATMKGMLARFFIALGDDEKKVTSAKFSPDFEDYIGRPCVLVLSKVPDATYGDDEGWKNNIKGVKPAGSAVGTDGGGGGLL